MIGTLYRIVNRVNGKSYIGKTYLSLEERFASHVADSKSITKKHRPLYTAFTKYGKDNFYIEELGKFPEGLLEDKEIEFIELYDTFSSGHNATKGGDGRRYLAAADSEIVEYYFKCGNVRDVARHFRIDPGYCSTILRNNKINIQTIKEVNRGKLSKVLILDIFEEFDNAYECAKFLVECEIPKTKDLAHVARSINRACNGSRKSAYGLTFMYI